MHNKYRILFFIDHFHVAGGTETHLAHLATGLDKTYFSPAVVVFDFEENQLAEKIRASNIPLIHIPVGRLYGLNAIKKGFVLSKLIKEFRPDIIQTFHIKSDTYGVMISKLNGVKHIISSKRDTGDLKKKTHFMLNKIFNPLIKGWISVCDEVALRVVEKENVPRSKIKTIYNGVDTAKFDVPSDFLKQEARRMIKVSNSDYVIGTVSWLRPEKGHDVFFKAVKSTVSHIKDVKFVVIGGGPLLDYYKNQLKEKDLDKKVLLIGPVNEVEKYLPAFDVACLFPVRNEGFSNAIIEKMATGLPMVVTDVGGNKEAVIDGYNGFVVPPNNPEALSEAMIRLFENQELRKNMGERSRKRVLEFFSLEAMVRNHQDYYEAIINQK